MNFISLSGNLGSDPEIKFFDLGSTVTRLSIAHRFYKGKNKEPETGWMEVEIWGKLGERVADSFKRGDFVIVNGTLDYQSWEKSDGGKGSKFVIKANDCFKGEFPKSE